MGDHSMGTSKMDINEQYTEDLTKKTKKPGVVYLNYIPRYMTVKSVRAYFSEFGEVRRIFLKPEKTKKSGKPSKFFSEGWIEFGKRRIAKQVADSLNGAQVGGKRHCPYYDALWSIKYLKKFQWSQLHEKQAYLKAKKSQRMRAEIAQVKREVDFYTTGVEKSKRLKKRPEGETVDTIKSTSNPQNTSTETHEDDKSSDERNKLLLRKVFGNL